MLQRLKTEIQNYQIKHCQREYEKEAGRQTDRYESWLSKKENHVPSIAEQLLKENPELIERLKKDDGNIRLVSYEEAEGAFPFQNLLSEILVFADLSNGTMEIESVNYIRILFALHPEWDMIYADEDYMCGTRRVAPWMKPDWSPDTLMAFPYIGHFFALRRNSYATVEWLEGEETAVRVYDFLLKCAERSGQIVHIPKVLYHNTISAEQLAQYDALGNQDPAAKTIDENIPWLAEKLQWQKEAQKDSYTRVRLAAMERRGYPGTIEEDCYGVLQPVYDVKTGVFGKKPLVSIVIPSKDNVEILERCLRSIRKYTSDVAYEILVVDNGSCGAARTKLINLERELGFRYYYEPMEFNFSAMVNLGVQRADGDYILLLNDDCEVIQKNWLGRMLGQAQLPHVGAVGAKLLYPDTDLIQHAGVTNLKIGPGHKLQRESDAVSYYYGHNRFCYDYIGVTAACLLVSKKIYEQVGGFPEELKVAYNDVDFCFSVVEAGYYNVMRNDVILYHHESLSRGDDLMSPEKTKRLLGEREKLYERHPMFEGKDPFYSENLIGNAIEYSVYYRYPYESYGCYSTFSRNPQEILQDWYNNSIYVTIEQAGRKRIYEGAKAERAYFIEGWAYVLNQDNSRYRMQVFLQSMDGKFYSCDVFRKYRADVVRILPEQKNIALSGFVAKLKASDLKTGEYRIYLMMKDQCSRQRLFKDTGSILRVE